MYPSDNTRDNQAPTSAASAQVTPTTDDGGSRGNTSAASKGEAKTADKFSRAEAIKVLEIAVSDQIEEEMSLSKVPRTGSRFLPA